MTAPHDKLAGIKPGDRVRVSQEGVVSGVRHGLSVLFDGATTAHSIDGQRLSFDSAHIERIEPPLAAGDKVRSHGTVWIVVDIRQPRGGVDQVAVWNDEDGFAVFERGDLERIP